MSSPPRLKVLVLSNRFPPDAEGGYEETCSDLVLELRNRGVDVAVLTRSSLGYPDESWVNRVLSYRSSADRSLLIRAADREIQDLKAAQVMYNEFNPDVLYLWNLVGLSLTAVAWLMRRLPSLCYVAEHWFTDWVRGVRLPDGYAQQLFFLANGKVPGLKALERWISEIAGGALAKKWINWTVPLPTLVQYDSAFMLQEAQRNLVFPSISKVVHHGIRFERFPFRNPLPMSNSPRLLFVGRIVPSKGPHLAIESLPLIIQRYPSATLTLVGPVTKTYRRDLERLAETKGVLSNIRFAGKVSRDDLPDLYHSHHLLIFPSEWKEPFGITLIEAMACGLPIVSSGVGGAAEAAPDGVGSLWFQPGDWKDLALRVVQLLSQEDQRELLAQTAFSYCKARFGLENMTSAVVQDFALALRHSSIGR